MTKNSHCSFCGHPFAEQQPWPRTCGNCGQTSFVNPLPVVVMLLPVEGGLLQIRRGIEPGLGKWAFPGGMSISVKPGSKPAPAKCWKKPTW